MLEAWELPEESRQLLHLKASLLFVTLQALQVSRAFPLLAPYIRFCLIVLSSRIRGETHFLLATSLPFWLPRHLFKLIGEETKVPAVFLQMPVSVVPWKTKVEHESISLPAATKSTAVAMRARVARACSCILVWFGDGVLLDELKRRGSARE